MELVDSSLSYGPVCAEGRSNAFRILGKSQVPTLVVDVGDRGAFIISLAGHHKFASPRVATARWRSWPILRF